MTSQRKLTTLASAPQAKGANTRLFRKDRKALKKLGLATGSKPTAANTKRARGRAGALAIDPKHTASFKVLQKNKRKFRRAEASFTGKKITKRKMRSLMMG